MNLQNMLQNILIKYKYIHVQDVNVPLSGTLFVRGNQLATLSVCNFNWAHSQDNELLLISP